MGRNIAIVGSGIAGDEAAFAARRLDPEASITVFTRDPYPLYSACVLGEYIAGKIPRRHVLLRDPEEYSASGIELRMSSDVKSWNREHAALEVNNGTVPCDALIIATGSRTFIPPIPGIEKNGVFSLKSLADADAIIKAPGKNAVVVGSGPVGIEAAVALRHRGMTVTLIELLGHVLPSLFDAPLSETIHKILVAHGIDVHTGERLLEVLGDAKVTQVKTDRGTVDCDVLVLVAGMRPVVDLAAGMGITLGDSGGLAVGDDMRTSVEGVWACGDCVETRDRVTGKKGTYMLWNNARLQGRVAGANASGGSLHYPGSLNVTTVDICDTGVAAVGTLAGACPEGEVEIIHRAGHLGELWLVFRDDHLIGAQAIGRVDQIGGILKILLKKGLLKSTTDKNRLLEYWCLRNFRKEMAHSLHFNL